MDLGGLKSLRFRHLGSRRYLIRAGGYEGQRNLQ